MDFWGYFDATEENFAQEKEDILYKIDSLGESWDLAIHLDQVAIQKSQELMNLKKILRKGNLQILRTKEECLIMELKNAELAFQVRKLQSEISRLLPYVPSNIPSTDYHMSLEQNLPQEEPKLVCDSDSKFLKAQKKIREKWIYLQRLQDRVFEEDLKSISEDNEQWEKFSSDFKSHNHSTHQMIDQQLSSLTNKTNELRNNYDDLVRKKSEQLKKLEKKYEEIQEKSKSNLTFLSEKSLNERDKIRNDASEQCNIVRSRVREIERKNLVRVSHMKEKDNILQRKENDLVQETDELSSDIEKIININKGIADEGAARIKSLENQLNAIISATTAVPNENDIVHERILNAVSTAIGKHARSARNVENVNLQIQSLNKKKKILREHC